MVTIEIKVDLPDPFLADVLTTAVEGGINYWVENCERIERTHNHPPFDDLTVLAVVGILPVESDDGKRYTAALETVAKGIELITSGQVGLRSDLLDQVTRAVVLVASGDEHAAGEIDADAADCIVQAGLFGEVVYG